MPELSTTPKSSISKGVPLESGYEECGHSCAGLGQHKPSSHSANVVTYVVHRDKFSFVLKYHYLVLCIATNFGVLPVINCDLCGFGAVVARHVKHPASSHILFAARALFADARGVVEIRVRRHCASAKPRVTSLRWPRKWIDQERHAGWR